MKRIPRRSLRAAPNLLSLRKTVLLVDSAILAASLFGAQAWAKDQETKMPKKSGLPTPVPSQVEVVDYRTARQLLVQRKWKKAVAALRTVLRQEPDRSNVKLDLVHALFFNGRKPQAFTLLNGVLKDTRSPKDIARLTKKIRYLGALFFRHEASQAYEQARILIEDRKYPQAVKKLAEAAKVEAGSPVVHLRRGQLLVSEGKVDESLADLNKVTELTPVIAEGWLWRARAEFLSGKLDESELSYGKAWQAGSRGDLFWAWRAELWNAKGENRQARQKLTDYLKKNPMAIRSLLQLASIKMSAAEGETLNKRSLFEARKSLQLALSRIGEYEQPEVDTAYGWTMERAEDFKKQIDERLSNVDSLIERAEL